MDWDSFFIVHRDLPREGPGCAADVHRAVGLAGLPPHAVICDAAAGPGGDLAALRAAAPDARIVAFDKMEGFVAQMRGRTADDPAVTVLAADLAEIDQLDAAPFDMIWCAGALYFLGLEDGLARMHAALNPGGVLAFSEPCFFVEPPSERARAFWEGYPTRGVDGITQAVTTAGFEILDQRPVPDAGWEAYFQPMEARIDDLRAEADAALTGMLDACATEAALWRELRAETGYLLTVGRRA